MLTLIAKKLHRVGQGRFRNNGSQPEQPVQPIVPPTRWYFLGDSQTAGRAVEASAIAPPVVFNTVWVDSGIAAPSYVYRNGGSGRSLANTYLHYQGQNIPSTPWVHIQESGWINDTGQETPEAYVATYETFFNDIRTEFPDALITCETSFSYRRDAQLPHLARPPIHVRGRFYAG